MSRSLSRGLPRRVILVLVLALAVVLRARLGGDESDVGSIEAAWRDRAEGIMVDAGGSVQRLLADDEEGSRHQRFVLALPSGHTVLVAHNIDLAPRVPLASGDEISLRGQYEWNEQGGVVHWTHHDPDGRHENGWIEHGGQRYQ